MKSAIKIGVHLYLLPYQTQWSPPSHCFGSNFTAKTGRLWSVFTPKAALGSAEKPSVVKGKALRRRGFYLDRKRNAIA